MTDVFYEKEDGVDTTTDLYKRWLRDLLHEVAYVAVKFTKKDGSDRTMLCTLNESNLPEFAKPADPINGEEPKVINYSDEALRVFDVDKQEWRSFRWDSIQSVAY